MPHDPPVAGDELAGKRIDGVDPAADRPEAGVNHWTLIDQADERGPRGLIEGEQHVERGPGTPRRPVAPCSRHL